MQIWQDKNVILRGLSNEHSDYLLKWNFSADISQFFPPRFPNSHVEQEEWFKRQSLAKDKKMLIIESVTHNAPVGVLSFMHIDHVNKNCEVGITIGEPDYWGTGIAKSAITLGLNFMFNNQAMHIIYARVLDTNLRAIAFLQRMGFEKDGILRDMVFMENRFCSWVVMSLTHERYNGMHDGK